MESIGTAGLRAIIRAKDSPVSRSNVLAKQAKRDADGLPEQFNRLVDLELPQRLICWRLDHGPVELRRAMRPDERAAVEVRCAALEIALQPHGDEDRADIEAAIAAMFSGFRSMRQAGEDAEAAIAITRAVLRDFPAWAIVAGCLKIARHETKCDPRFAPNDAELVDVVRALVKSYREAFEAASLLIGATVQPIQIPHRSSTRDSQQAHSIQLGDGKHAQRIAADLAARKARNEQAWSENV